MKKQIHHDFSPIKGTVTGADIQLVIDKRHGNRSPQRSNTFRLSGGGGGVNNEQMMKSYNESVIV